MNIFPRRPPRHEIQVDMWLDDLRASNYSPQTIRAYRLVVAQWRRSGLTPVQFLSATVGEGLKNASVKLRRTGLRNFFAWQVRMGYAKRNPLQGSKAPREDKIEIRPLTVPQVAALIKGCENLHAENDRGDDGSNLGYRLSLEAYRARLVAMVAVQVSSGLRVTELLDLRDSDLDLQKRAGVCRGKGRKERQFRIGRPALRAVKRWLEIRNAELPVPAQYLFCASSGKGIDPPVYRRQLADASWWAGLPRVHPHLLRHTFATNAALAGTPVQDLAAMLGHSNILTTMRYVHLTAGRRAWDALEERLDRAEAAAKLAGETPEDREEDTPE